MKRILFLLAVVSLTLPATALAKGPSEASIKGPGLDKAIKITGAEVPGSSLMNFAEGAGFFPAAFGQTPDPMLSSRPKGTLGPKYTIDYTVPGPDNDSYAIRQYVYPYAKPYAVTYMPSGQAIFYGTTRGGWYESPILKQTLVSAGLPARPPAAVSSNSFFSTGRVGAALLAVFLAAAAAIVMRRRARPTPTA